MPGTATSNFSCSSAFRNSCGGRAASKEETREHKNDRNQQKTEEKHIRMNAFLRCSSATPPRNVKNKQKRKQMIKQNKTKQAQKSTYAHRTQQKTTANTPWNRAEQHNQTGCLKTKLKPDTWNVSKAEQDVKQHSKTERSAKKRKEPCEVTWGWLG